MLPPDQQREGQQAPPSLAQKQELAPVDAAAAGTTAGEPAEPRADAVRPSGPATTAPRPHEPAAAGTRVAAVGAAALRAAWAIGAGPSEQAGAAGPAAAPTCAAAVGAAGGNAAAGLGPAGTAHVAPPDLGLKELAGAAAPRTETGTCARAAAGDPAEPRAVAVGLSVPATTISRPCEPVAVGPSGPAADARH